MEYQRDIPEVIRAKNFELVDDNGHVRAALGIDEDGNPGLAFLDKNEADLLFVGLQELDQEVASLAFYNQAGNHRMLLTSGNDNTSLTFFDQAGNFRLGLALSDTDTPFLSFFDQAGDPKLFLALGGDSGNPYIHINDRDGNLRLTIALEGDSGDPYIHIVDSDGNLTEIS